MDGGLSWMINKLQNLLAATTDAASTVIPNTIGMKYAGKQAALITLMVLMVIFSIAMIIVVMMQQGTNENVTAVTGGQSDTYFGRNKGRNKQSMMKILTTVLFVLLIITSIIYCIINLVSVGV